MLMSPNLLPAPDGRNRVFFESGYNNDIIKVLNGQFSEAVAQCGNVHFSGTTLKDKGRAIYNFLRSRVDYEKDPDGKQLIQLPARLIRGTKKGDCKSLSLAAAAFMYCSGFNNVRLRYASYSPTDNTPSHVYAVATDENGKDIIIDAVYKHFNKELPYNHKKDYKMQIAVLSGTPTAPTIQRKLNLMKKKGAVDLNNLLSKVRPGGFFFNVISNEILRQKGQTADIKYSGQQLQRYAAQVQNVAAKQSGIMAELLKKEAKVLSSGNFSGTIYTKRSGAAIRGIEEEIGKLSLKKLGKKVGKRVQKTFKKISPKNLLKGVKAVGLIAPRKAFLLLVRLNVRGLATRLNKLPESDLKKFWVDRFAGNLSTLKTTLKAGAKKKPLFGAGKKVRNISGVGVVLDETNDQIGATGAEIAAVIGAAAPVLVIAMKLLKGKGVPPVPEGAASAESAEFSDAEGAAAEAKPGLEGWIDKAMNIAQATGIIPEKPNTENEEKVNNIAPGDDLQADPAAPRTSFKIAPVVVAAGLVGAYFLLRKKK